MFCVCVTEERKHSMHYREFILLLLNHREWCLLFSLQGIEIIHVSHKEIFPMCVFPQSVIVVNCSFALPAYRKSYKTVEPSDSTQTGPSSSSHLFASPFRSVFCPCTFKCSAIRPDYVWRQLTKRRLGIIKWGYFTFSLPWVTFRHFWWKGL